MLTVIDDQYLFILMILVFGVSSIYRYNYVYKHQKIIVYRIRYVEKYIYLLLLASELNMFVFRVIDIIIIYNIILF